MNLYDRARSFLGGRSPAPDEPTATNAVLRDAFDEIVYDDVMEATPVLKRLADELGREVGWGDDLVQDTWMQLFQATPEVRPGHEMRRTHRANHAAADAISMSPELADAREVTQRDEYGAAMAATAVGRTAAEEVRKYRKRIEEAGEEEEKAAQAADDAADQLQQTLDQLDQLQQEIDEAAQDGEPVGSERMDQLAELTRALSDQLDQAQQAEAAQQQAKASAQATQQQVGQIMQGAMGQALSEAAKELNEENELMSAYGVGPGERQQMSVAERIEAAKLLKGSRLEEFRKLIGNMRMNFRAQQRTKTVMGRDHVIGLTRGGMNDIIEEELASLVMPAMRLDLLQRLSTEQALNFDYEGKEKVGDGAIIVCIDNSGSMAASADGASWQPGAGVNTREAWAKALALALLDSAQRSSRDFVAINFSSWYKPTVHHFPKGRHTLPELVAFVEEFQGGGTEFEPPLLMALDIMRSEYVEHRRARADVVFITDDECRVRPEWVREHIEPSRKELGFKIWGVAIGAVRDSGAMRVFADDVRSITDLSDVSAVNDMARTIR